MRKTIHFEGIAGSGKSTASARFCEILRGKDVDATWWLEESPDHPIMPKELRALSRKKDRDFPQVCLDAWASFLGIPSDAVGILDGYAFQNTVRFMFEQCTSTDQIVSYFERWQEFATDTSITYFRVDDLVDHYDSVLPERGENWTQKLFAWIEQTPVGTSLNLRGKSGFVEFWSIYQELCLELLSSAFIEVQIIEARCWDDADLHNLALRRGFLAQV